MAVETPVRNFGMGSGPVGMPSAARAPSYEELLGLARLLHGPNFEMLHAPSDNARGRLTILPPGLPAPFFEGNYYKSPYQNEPPKKKLQRPSDPRDNEPAG